MTAGGGDAMPLSVPTPMRLAELVDEMEGRIVDVRALAQGRTAGPVDKAVGDT